jgi:hypothetical protein
LDHFLARLDLTLLPRQAAPDPTPAPFDDTS